MDKLSTANLIYLGLLLAALSGYALASARQDFGRFSRHVALWGLIFLGAIAIVGLWGDISRQVRPMQSASGGRIEVPRSGDGHFYLTAALNGRPVTFVVDTGASSIVLTRADAEAAGIDTSRLAFIGTALTANGEVRTAPVTIDEVQLGEIIDSGVRAVVNEGEMDGSLLGQSYLKRFRSMTIAGDRLVLER